MQKYTQEQRVARARLALMNHKTWCLYSGLLMLGSLEIDDNISTACTNGRDVVIDRAFAESLPDPELRFLILHENEHKALRQLTTYAFLWKQNAQLCNMAADFVVNLRLLDADEGKAFIKMPEGGCYDEKYRGWNTKQVFDDLMKQTKEKPEGGEGKGEGRGEGKGEAGKAGKAGHGKPLDEHDFEGAEELSEAEKKELKKEIETAIRQGGILAGRNKGNRRNHLEEVLDSGIRWQEVLAEFIKATTKGRDSSSWAKVNRRYVAQGLYLPSSVSETVGGLLIAGDASGSTWSGNQLAGFLGEAKAIIQDVVPEFVDFIWWDTSVQTVWRFLPEQYDTMLETIKAIQGGGGTRPSCITDWMKKEQKDYVAAIVLSDGQVGNDWGDWNACGAGGASLPVLFCLNTKGITAPIGQTIYIEDVQH